MRLHEAKHERAKKRAELMAKRAELRALKAVHRQKLEELPPDQDMPAEDTSAMDSLVAEVNSLEAQFDALDVRVTRLEALQDTDADDTGNTDQTTDPGEEVDAGLGGGVRRGIRLTPQGYGEASRKQFKGAGAARFIIGLVIANEAKSFEKAAERMERVYGDKAVAKALNTAGNSTGGAFIPQNFANDLIELLRPESVVLDLEPVTYDISGGNLTVPRLTSAATASYQGELDDMSASQPSADDVQLNAKKLTALVPVSNDLIRRAAINVEQVVLDDMKRVMALRRDLAMMLGDGSGGSLIGLINLVIASNKLIVLPFTAFDNLTISTAVIGILNAMIAQLRNNMSRMIRVAWIMDVPTEMFLRGIRDGVGSFIFKEEMESRGTLNGFRYKVTQQIPSNLNTQNNSNPPAGSPVNNGSYLFLADFADVIVGETLRMQTDVSSEASYRDAGGNLVSAFTRDQTVARVIDEHDFNLRHTASVAVALLPGWVPAGFGGYGPGASYYVEPTRNDSSAAPSTWGAAAPTGSNNPGNISANVPGGLQPGRP